MNLATLALTLGLVFSSATPAPAHEGAQGPLQSRLDRNDDGRAGPVERGVARHRVRRALRVHRRHERREDRRERRRERHERREDRIEGRGPREV
jgi:hypothetical protein